MKTRLGRFAARAPEGPQWEAHIWRIWPALPSLIAYLLGIPKAAQNSYLTYTITCDTMAGARGVDRLWVHSSPAPSAGGGTVCEASRAHGWRIRHGGSWPPRDGRGSPNHGSPPSEGGTIWKGKRGRIFASEARHSFPLSLAPPRALHMRPRYCPLWCTVRQPLTWLRVVLVGARVGEEEGGLRRKSRGTNLPRLQPEARPGHRKRQPWGLDRAAPVGYDN